jgi:hypothetical protein
MLSAKPESEIFLNFLANSDDLKQLRRLAIIIPPSIGHEESNGVMREVKYNPAKEMLEKISSARTFAELLKATDKPGVDSIVARSIFFFGSFIHNEASFGYHLMQLRQKAIEIVANNGYRSEPSPTPSL